jgi:hypothetical protein
MPSKTERTAINKAGLPPSIVLAAVLAASTIFTEKNECGLSNSQYGDMFLPQVAPGHRRACSVRRVRPPDSAKRPSNRN